MKIKIAETSEILDVTVVDWRTGLDIMPDLLDMWDREEGYQWDDADQCYILPQESADWWTEYADGHAETEAEINRLWEVINGLTIGQQQEILPSIGISDAWRHDVAEYVYQDHPDWLSDERTLAEDRLRELETAITYAQQDPDLWAVKARKGWEHPDALHTVTSGTYQGWIIIPVDQISEEDLEADPDVIRYVTCRTIDHGHGRETDYFPPDDKMGNAIRF